MERDIDFSKEDINDKKVYEYISTRRDLRTISDRISWNARFTKELNPYQIEIYYRYFVYIYPRPYDILKCFMIL